MRLIPDDPWAILTIWQETRNITFGTSNPSNLSIMCGGTERIFCCAIVPSASLLLRRSARCSGWRSERS
jgi:hypothetical protein